MPSNIQDEYDALVVDVLTAADHYNTIVLSFQQLIIKWLHTLFILYLVSASGALNEKPIEIESSNASSSSVVLVGHDLSGRDLSIHLFSRLLSFLDNDQIVYHLSNSTFPLSEQKQLSQSSLGLLLSTSAASSTTEDINDLFFTEENIKNLNRTAYSYSSLAYSSLQVLRFTLIGREHV